MEIEEPFRHQLERQETKLILSRASGISSIHSNGCAELRKLLFSLLLFKIDRLWWKSFLFSFFLCIKYFFLLPFALTHSLMPISWVSAQDCRKREKKTLNEQRRKAIQIKFGIKYSACSLTTAIQFFFITFIFKESLLLSLKGWKTEQREIEGEENEKETL